MKTFYYDAADINRIKAYYHPGGDHDSSWSGLTRIDDPSGDFTDGVDVTHHRIVDSTITEMTQAEKDAHPLNDLATHKVEKRGQLRLQMLGTIDAVYDTAQLLGLVAAMLKGIHGGFTNRNNKIAAVIDWVEQLEGEYYAASDAVNAAADHSTIDAVTADFAQFTPPTQTVRDAKETTN